jgi:hypothetical protein
MTTQTRQGSQFTEVTNHVHLGLETCPTCGQEIPPDKIEEIGGRIAAREREQALTITLELEKQFAIEKSAAEAKANADLESERQQSARREQQARDEAQRAAEKLINEQQAQIDQERTALVAGWEQRLADSELARTAAQQTEASLQAKIIELRKETAGAIDAVKTEAKQREVQIQDQAKQSAESAAAERIKQIEASHHESEAALAARITAAEANRITAEENHSVLASELEELRRTKDAEVDKLKQEAAANLLRVRQIASDDAEARFRDKLAAQENAAAEANTKAREAETKLQEFTVQQATELEAQLNAQRDVLEKSKEDAVNAEKAKAFDENQKLSTKVSDLQRAFDNKTAEELGEGAEVDLYEDLRKEFPSDDIQRVPKGTSGADIIHAVLHSGKTCGTIIYDSKNHNQFRWEHVSKLRSDQLGAKAEHAILSTRKFPQGTRQLHLHDGVLIANPARVVVIATMIRLHLMQLHAQRVSGIERDAKTAALYDFIVSERCASLLTRIDERADDLLEQQNKEIKWHESNWKKQGEAIRAIQKAKADVENQIHLIIGTSAEDAAA